MNESLKKKIVDKALPFALAYTELDARQKDQVSDAIASLLFVAIFAPLNKRYYRKKGAPPWVAPATFMMGLRLSEIAQLLRRQERQAIRERLGK